MDFKQALAKWCELSGKTMEEDDCGGSLDNDIKENSTHEIPDYNMDNVDAVRGARS